MAITFLSGRNDTGTKVVQLECDHATTEFEILSDGTAPLNTLETLQLIALRHAATCDCGQRMLEAYENESLKSSDAHAT